MATNKQLINDWLNCIEKDTHFLDNNSLIDAIFKFLEEYNCDEQLLESICNELYSYYRSDDQQLRLFCLSFIPTLIGVHIIQYNNNILSERHKYRSIDVLLLGIYNLEVVDSDGQLKCRTFRLASLSKPSLYHEPSLHSSNQTQSSLLTELALSKLETSSGDIKIALFGPYLEIEQIVANNRMDVMTVLLKVFNENISSLSKQSLSALCRMSLRLLRQGSVNLTEKTLNSTNINCLLNVKQLISRNSTRIQLSSQFLVELTNSVYFCLFNDVTDLAFEALEDIHTRAVIQLYTDVLLMTNAIRNSILINSGQPSDGPMGINVALSPTSNTLTATGIAKTAITNASFKTRKLPDDIPIVVLTNNTICNNTTMGGLNQLGPINEENEEIAEKTIKGSIKGVTAGIGKMAVMQLLKERKDKKKDVNPGQKNKLRAENGDLVNNKVILHDDSGNENGSDTSGISDSISKLSYSEETIPLTVFNQAKTYFDVNDDEVSNSSSNTSADTAKVPLINTDSAIGHSIIKHNNSETSVNV